MVQCRDMSSYCCSDRLTVYSTVAAACTVLVALIVLLAAAVAATASVRVAVPCSYTSHYSFSDRYVHSFRCS